MIARFERDSFSESTNTAYGVDSERSTKSLLRELMHEVPELFTKEVALARAEMRENVEQTRRGASEVSTGGVVVAGGYIVLLVADDAGLYPQIPAQSAASGSLDSIGGVVLP